MKLSAFTEARKVKVLAAAQALALTSKEKVLSLLTALIRHPTYEPNQCIGAASLVATAMRESGFEVESHVPTNLAGDKLPTIIGWLGPRTQRPDILLNAHVDTSPAGSGWTHEPFGAERAAGLLFGRGSVVSKSDIACFIFAARAAYEAAEDSRLTIAVAITSDEGSGGDLGAAYLLNKLHIRPAVAICPGVTDAAIIAHNGCVQMKVKITGTACHQSLLRPEEDAMRRATQLCGDINALGDQLASCSPAMSGALVPTLNITRIFGGAEFGMAPREVEIWIDRRVTPDEQLEDACRELLDIVDKKSNDSTTSLACTIVRLAEPMRPPDKQHHFVTLLIEETQAACGRDLRVMGSTLYTDARWFSNAGIPTVMYGAGEADMRVSGANGIDERLPEVCLEQATVVLARAMVRFILEKETGSP